MMMFGTTDMSVKKLKQRILDISYELKLSHLSSCITAVPIIDAIYLEKKKKDVFVLSSGHAGLALYVVLEKYEGRDALELFNKHGVHPNRDIENGIYASSGSLGHGIGIAVGMALADRTRNVYVLLSDGECSEGSVTESLRVAVDLNLTNLKIYINHNGYSAYRRTRDYHLPDPRLAEALDITVITTSNSEFPFLQGLKGHYHVMSEQDYEIAKVILND